MHRHPTPPADRNSRSWMTTAAPRAAARAHRLRGTAAATRCRAAGRGAGGAVAGLGEPCVDVYRGRRRAVAGPGCRVGRADRMGARQCSGGARQRDRNLAVHRHPGPVGGSRAPRPARRGRVLLAACPLHRRPVRLGPRRRAPRRGNSGRDRPDRRRAGGDAAAGTGQARLAGRLGSPAVAGEGTQNYLCVAQAAAVLVGLAVTAAWPGDWWADPVTGLAIAAAAAWEGIQSWRGDDCC